jgi:hypothetical protein
MVEKGLTKQLLNRPSVPFFKHVGRDQGIQETLGGYTLPLSLFSFI